MTDNPDKRFISKALIPLFLGWTALVFYRYVSESLIHALLRLKTIILWAAIFVLIKAVGKSVRKRILEETVSFIEELSLDFLTGTAVFYFLFLAAALAGILNSAAVYFIVFAALLISLGDARDFLTNLYGKTMKYSRNRFSVTGAVFLVLLCAGAMMILASSLAPHAAGENGYISASRELSGRIAQASGFGGIEFFYASHLPSAMSVLESALIVASGRAEVSFFRVFFLLVTLIAIFSFCRKFFHRRIGLFASAVFISTPVVYMFLSEDASFTGSSLYAFMALYCFVSWSSGSSDAEDTGKPWLMFSGFFSAVSLSFAYYSLFIPMALMLLSGYFILRSRDPSRARDFTSGMVVFIMPFMLGLLPELYRNYLLSGTPLFPFFPGTYDPSLFIESAAETSLWGKLYPLWSSEIGHRISLSDLYMSGTVLPLFIPMALFVSAIGKTMRVMLIYLGIYTAIYLLAGREALLLYTLIPAASVFCAYVIINLYGIKRNLRKLVMAAMISGIVLNFFKIVPMLSPGKYLAPALGIVSYEAFLEETGEDIPMISYVNSQTAVDAYILCQGIENTFYMDRRILAPGILDSDPLTRFCGASSGTGVLREKLAEKRLTHILVDENGENYPSDAAKLFKGLKVLKKSGSLTLYKL
jgi:hypothetical protein